MKRRHLLTAVATAATVALVAQAAVAAPSQYPTQGVAKNIIFMVPDGMGLADVTATRLVLGGANGPSLAFENLPQIGYQRTWSANSTITDSAAAASAWACGEKYPNDVICSRADGSHPANVLELMQRRGKATGLVATSTITHATPAAFGAHVKTRTCESEIARQYIVETKVDVLLGDGRNKFVAGTPDACQAVANGTAFIAQQAVPRGYAVVSNAAQLEAAVAAHSSKLLGLFKDPVDGYASADGMTPEYRRSVANTEPHLAGMATAALATLARDPDGFFLLVEGSQIDWANHANDIHYQLGEMEAFNDATKAVIDWVNASPARRAQTLVVVVADHETGGFAINGPYGSLTPAGGTLTPGWTTADHTGSDTMIWSQGPGSERLGRALDNTDLYAVMVEAARLGQSGGHNQGGGQNGGHGGN